MKKVISLILASCLVLSVFAACSKKDTDSSSDDASNSAAYDVAAVAEEIENVVSIGNSDMTRDLDVEELEFLGIDEESYSAFAGKYSTLDVDGGIVAVVQATDGHADEIKTAFEQRRQSLVGDPSQYPQYALFYAQAEAGRVVVKGNYVVFVISCNAETIDGIDSDYAKIDIAIDKAFN